MGGNSPSCHELNKSAPGVLIKLGDNRIDYKTELVVVMGVEYAALAVHAFNEVGIGVKSATCADGGDV